MSSHVLADLGWSAFYLSQLSLDEVSFSPARVSEVHRSRLECLIEDGSVSIEPGDTSLFAVGDWVLLEGSKLIRRLDRRSELTRKAAGTSVQKQLIAANVDTLLIVTSCNADFNPSRLERYLALAAEAGCEAVLLLTKADLVEDAADYVRRAEALSQGVIALPVNALDPPLVCETLEPWVKSGQTVALVGSSGVGKTTVTNALTGRDEATQGIREGDAKGRHTTTYRALLPVYGGGWLIDTPGMRELRLADVADGIATVFSDIEELAEGCRFRDCTHVSEPGCAVLAAIDTGLLDPRRLANWQKLKREDRYNSETLAEARDRNRRFTKMVKKALALKENLEK